MSASSLPVGFERFPTQVFIGQRVRLTFGCDFSRWTEGELVRCDAGPPNVLIFRLDDGRLVLGTECQYTLPR